VLKFDRDSHTYTWNGTPVVNVTRITDSLNDYAGVPEAIMRAAADRGDAVHFTTELYDKDDLDEKSVLEEIRGYFNAWVRFREETGFVPSHIESRVFSERYRYAGTLDRAGFFRKLRGVKPTDTTIVDIKATASLMPGVGPQTAAYQTAFQESAGVSTRHRFAVRLKPDGTYQLEHLTNPADFSVFLSAMTMYAWRQRHGMKEITR
jgi:hypothetical protein